MIVKLKLVSFMINFVHTCLPAGRYAQNLAKNNNF